MPRNRTRPWVCAATIVTGVIALAGCPEITPSPNGNDGDATSGPTLRSFDDLLALAASLGLTDVAARTTDDQGRSLAVTFTPADAETLDLGVLMMSGGVGTIARPLGAIDGVTGWELYYDARGPMALLSADAITLPDGTVVTFDDDSAPSGEPNASSTLKATVAVDGAATVDLSTDATREISCIASGGVAPYTIGLEHESGADLTRFDQVPLSNRVDATVEFAAPVGTHRFLCAVVDAEGTLTTGRVDVTVLDSSETASATTQPNPDAARVQTDETLTCADNGRTVAAAAKSLAGALFACADNAFDPEDTGREGYARRFTDCLSQTPSSETFAALADLTAGLVECCPPVLTIGTHTSCLNAGETTAFTAIADASNGACHWDVVHFLANPSPGILTTELAAREPTGSPPRSEADASLVAIARGTVDLDYQLWVAFAGTAQPHVRSTVRINVAECDACQRLDATTCACVGEPCATEPDTGNEPSNDGNGPDQPDNEETCRLDGSWVEIGTDVRWTILDGHLIRVDSVAPGKSDMACEYDALGGGRSELLRETPSTQGETFNCNSEVDITCTGSTGSIVGFESFRIDFAIDGDAMTFFTAGAELSRWQRQ